MINALPISAKQAELILAAQAQVGKAQRELNIVVSTVLAGHDAEGQVVSVDTDLNVLNVEVADESEAKTVEHEKE